MASGETPFTHAFAIVPDNTVNLPSAVRQIYVGAAGTLYDIQAKKVWSTGTSASSLVGIY